MGTRSQRARGPSRQNIFDHPFGKAKRRAVRQSPDEPIRLEPGAGTGIVCLCGPLAFVSRRCPIPQVKR